MRAMNKMTVAAANTVSKVKRRMESRIAAMLGMYDC